MFKEPNALPIPPQAFVTGAGTLTPAEIDAKIDALLPERDRLSLIIEFVEQQIRYLRSTKCGPTKDLQHVEDYKVDAGIPRPLIDWVQRSIGQLQWLDDLADRFKPPHSPGTVSGLKWGTGALIGRNWFLTSGHAFDQTGGYWVRPSRNGELILRDEIATLMKVVFNYQAVGGTNGKVMRAVQEFPILALLEHSSDERTRGGIDYAILELGPDTEGRLPGEVFDYLPVAATDVTAPGSTLVIVQHPSRGPKKVDVGTLHKMEGGLMSYNDIDTAPGSSGSPVLNTKGEIVGVHFYGACQADGPPDTGANYAQPIGTIRAASSILG
jgi:V8-like Glu-specific endopeptidase